MPVPAPAARSTQSPAPLTAAELAKLASMAQDQANYDKEEILILCAVALAIIAVAAAAIGWMIAGRVLRPISTITAAARHIAASSLHERLDLHGPDDELKELADTLDSLLARLEGSFDAERRFAANASHELRTPSPGNARCSRSPWPTPAPPSAPGGRSARSCSPPMPNRSASSRRCSRWPAARPTPASPSGLDWPSSPATPGRRPARDRRARPARPGRLETAAINGDPRWFSSWSPT